MAISISCPSCNQPFGLPESFAGGRATCPNPQCGKTFYAPGPATATAPATDGAAQPAAGRLSGRGRRPPGRPAAVSHIPPNIYASPAFVAGGGVVVLLYTLVMFAVLGGQRREAELAAYHAPPEPELPLVIPEPSPEAVTKGKAPPAPPPAPEKAPEKKATEAPKANEKGKNKGKGKGKGKSKSAAKSKSDTPAPKASPPSVAAADAASATNPQPAPAPRNDTPKGKAPPAADKAVALNTAPTKPAESQPAPTLEGPTFNGLTPWVDTGNVAKPRREDDAIVVALPPGIHILSPELKHKDAPMSLTDVTGDFEVRVRVAGGIRPGSKPPTDIPGLPIAFQGAGLLLWQDQDNYLRFERAAMNGPKQQLTQKVIVEVCRDGQPSGSIYKDTSDKPVYLRLTRKGDDLDCAYSPDGKTWIVVKKSSIALFPDKVRVGISACNLSPRPFQARFEAFTLDRSGGKSAAR